MAQTKQASPNGVTVMSFFEGKEYILSPELAKALLGCYKVVKDISEVVEKPEAVIKPEKKNVGAAPKNKAVTPKENK